MTTVLKDSNDKAISVNAGESCNVVVEFIFEEATILKSAITAVTVTLYDETALSVINSRSAQSVFDANNGTMASDGTLTLRLGPLDNVIVGTVAVGATQLHICRFTVTFSDGVASRTGIEQVAIRVLKMATPA